MVHLEKSQENILGMFLHYFWEENFKQFKPFLATKVITDDFFI